MRAGITPPVAAMMEREREGTPTTEDARVRTGDRLIAVVQALGLELHSQRRGIARAGLDNSLERDFGIDSLARVELALRIEREFAVRLPEELVTVAETPAELVHAIDAAGPIEAASRPYEVLAPPDTAPIPVEAPTLVDALAFHVETHGDRPHVRLLGDGEREEVVTYRELWDGAQAVAAGLRERDLEMGQGVAIMLPTGRAFFEAFMGTLLAGGTPVPIYPPFRRAAIGEHLRRQAAILDNARVPVFVADAEARPFGRLLRSQVASLRHLDTVEGLKVPGQVSIRPVANPDGFALVQYTSGSTGDPKGVILSHRNLLANIRAMGQAFDVHAADVVVSWLPLYHDMGLIGAWLGALYHACPLVIMSPLSFLARPQRWLWAIHRHRGTLSAAPNFAYELCATRVRDRDIEGLDLSTWRMAGNGAEGVSARTVRGFCERFAKHGFRAEAMTPMYGLAECSVALSSSPLGRGVASDRVDRARLAEEGEAWPPAREGASTIELVSCGVAMPGHEIRVVDEGDRELGERVQGHLQFRGPSATVGYLRNPEKTAALFHDGWLETGDLGYLAGGELYVTGRVKDVIVRAGRNIYPEEIEAAVGAAEGVRKGRVAVFGARDAASGTEGLVVLAETRLADEVLRSALVERIHALVSDLIELPPDDVMLGPPGSVLKTLNGKVRRADCARLYEAGRIGERAPAPWRQAVVLVGHGVGPLLRRWRRALAAFAFAARFWVLYWFVVPFVFVGVVASPRRRWRRSMLKVTAQAFMRLLGAGPVVRGLEHVPADKPCIVVANHASFLDGLVLSAVLPPVFAFVAKRELVASPIARPFLRALGTAFVERFDPARGVEDARYLASALGERRALAWFPEGTFDRRPGLRSFEMGAFVVAARVGVPVIPAGIHGTRSMLRAESAFPRRSLVTVSFGPPIQPDGTDWAAALRLRDRTRAAVLEKCGEPDLVYEIKPI